MQKLPSETAVCALILLKSAAVIGNVFTLKQLRCVCDLDEHHLLQIGHQLNELENRDIVELLFEDGYGDKIYRFTHGYMRETLYSLQVFESQKRPVHGRFIGYLQENMMFNWQTGWSYDREQILMLQNLLEQYQYRSEKHLNYTQRQPLTIKKVNTAIFNQSSVIKQAEMSQQKYKKANGGGGSRSGSRNRGNSYARKESVAKQKIYQAVFVTLT